MIFTLGKNKKIFVVDNCHDKETMEFKKIVIKSFNDSLSENKEMLEFFNESNKETKLKIFACYGTGFANAIKNIEC